MPVSTAVDTSPLRASPHFRRVWIGRSISFFGGQLTMVAVPYQVFRITGSSLAVGSSALALERFDGDATTLGLLFAAPAVGAFVTTLLSGRAGRVQRSGRAVVISVLVWGAAIVGFGFSWSLGPALVALAIAGGADMMSGVFRMRIWATIPDDVRGRLAGFEWLNVNSGPALGDLEAGAVSSLTNPTFAIVSGGLLTIVGAVACAVLLPAFTRYRSGAEPSTDLQGS